jgi:predicted nucleic acid-binding protein
MKLVIDANSVIAALLKDSKARAIIVGGAIELISPDHIKGEIDKHLDYITEKAEISREDLEVLISLLFRNIEIVPYPEYKQEISEAERIMKADPEDVPYVACYIALRCDGIWTNDTHYLNKPRVKVFKTKDIIPLL